MPSLPCPSTRPQRGPMAASTPSSRAVDLMIAAAALSENLLLYTCNASDYRGLEALLEIVPVVAA